MKGRVSLVGAGPGAADLITLRGLRCLQAADVIYYDRLADPVLLDLARPGARCVPVGKAPGQHSKSQHQINQLLVTAARAGLRVVRLKCGDPGVFGRGGEEAAALDAAGIGWDIVPGVTAACGAAAAAGSFLTERGVTDRVVLATGQQRIEADAPDWTATARPGTTLACYMGVAQAQGVQAGLLAAGWPAAVRVDVVSKAQTPQQRVLRCALSDLAALCAQAPDLAPAMLLIRWPLEPQAVARAADGQALAAE